MDCWVDSACVCEDCLWRFFLLKGSNTTVYLDAIVFPGWTSFGLLVWTNDELNVCNDLLFGQLIQNLGFAHWQNVLLPSLENQLTQIINIDETALSLDWANGHYGGRPQVEFSYESSLPVSHRRISKLSKNNHSNYRIISYRRRNSSTLSIFNKSKAREWEVKNWCVLL